MLRSSWYAAYTYPRHEKQVVKHLELREIEAFLPLYTAVHRWKNRTTTTVQLPLFPGYVFVRSIEHELSQVFCAPGILSVVSNSGGPVPIPFDEIDAIRITTSQLSAEPHPFLRIGQRVRVRQGPLAGFEGFLVEKKSRYRLVISMNLIMQAVSVEIDASDVEAVASHFRISAPSAPRPIVAR